MPRFVFLAVNALPVYPSHAARLLRECLPGDSPWQWTTVETSLRESPTSVLEDILLLGPDALGVTFYLFNREWLHAFLKRFRILRPNTVVIGGGPEWLGDSRRFFDPFPLVHAGVRGEGEVAFPQWLSVWDRPEKWGAIQGLIWKDPQGRIVDEGREAVRPREEEIPLPRLEEQEKRTHPFVFLETMRGCSGACVFCTSAGRGGVRFFSLSRVKEELATLHLAGVREIRLLDRTFNDDEQRACERLMNFLTIAPDTRFHLEFDPTKMTSQLAAICRRFLPGLLHIEAGVQTLEPYVRAACGLRGTPLEVWAGLNLLRTTPAELHLDLLAGLPGQTWEGLLADLTALAAWGPEAIQLETVKILPGTQLARQATARGIRSSPCPPYEVLETPTFSFSNLRQAARLSRIVDWYYNERSLRPVVQRLSREIPDFWRNMEMFLSEREVWRDGLSLERRFALLYEWLSPERPSQRAFLTETWYRRSPTIHPDLDPARVRSPRLPEGLIREEGSETGPYWRVIEVEGNPRRYFAWRIENGGRRTLGAILHPKAQ